MRWGMLLLLAGCGLAEGPTEKGAVVHYDVSGNAKSGTSFDGVHIDAIAAHPSGGVVIAGSLHTGASDASNPHTAAFGGVMLTPSASHLDAFVARLGDAGDVEWVTRGMAGGDAHTVSLAVARDGTIVAGGSFARTLTFGATTLTQDATGFAAAPYEPFVAALGPDGAVEWAVNPVMGVGNGFVGGSVDRLAIDPPPTPPLPGAPSLVTGAITGYPVGLVVGKLDLSTGAPVIAVPLKSDVSDIHVGVTALAVNAKGETFVCGYDDAGGFAVKFPSLAAAAMGGGMMQAPQPLWTKDPFVTDGRADLSALYAGQDGGALVWGNADAGSTIGTTPAPQHSLFIAQVGDQIAGNGIFQVQLYGLPSAGGAWFNFASDASHVYSTGIALGDWSAGGVSLPAGPFVLGFDPQFAIHWIRAPQLDESMGVAQGTLGPLTVGKDGAPIIAAQYRLSAQLDGIMLQ